MPLGGAGFSRNVPWSCFGKRERFVQYFQYLWHCRDPLRWFG